MDIELARYLLPSDVLCYFNLVTHKSTDDKIHFYLEEKNRVPKEHESEIAHSKEFFSEITIEDFPSYSIIKSRKMKLWLSQDY